MGLSNSYCCAMMRFGIKRMKKFHIIFSSDLKKFVLSNVDRKYYQCIPKKRKPFRFQSGDVLLVHTKERWHDRIPFFSVRKQYFFTLKTLLAPPNAPLDVEIGLHRP